MRLREALDHAGERKHRPRGLAQHEPRDVVRPRHEAVTRGHAARDHAVYAPEELLVLELLFGEAHERFERGLVAERVPAAHFEHLRRDEPLEQAQHVGIGAALDLGEQRALAVA
jgi:hypothetical protein